MIAKLTNQLNQHNSPPPSSHLSMIRNFMMISITMGWFAWKISIIRDPNKLPEVYLKSRLLNGYFLGIVWCRQFQLHTKSEFFLINIICFESMKLTRINLNCKSKVSFYSSGNNYWKKLKVHLTTSKWWKEDLPQ